MPPQKDNGYNNKYSYRGDSVKSRQRRTRFLQVCKKPRCGVIIGSLARSTSLPPCGDTKRLKPPPPLIYATLTIDKIHHSVRYNPFRVFADSACTLCLPYGVNACGCVWANRPQNGKRTATLSNTLHYIDRTETSPPESKLLRADTGGIKNPPYDSNYTASREQSRARQAEQVPPLTAPDLRQPPRIKSSIDKGFTKSKTSSEKKY